MPPQNAFQGKNALFDYLNPQNGQYTPLVELPDRLNPYRSNYNIHIHAKLLHTLPLANVKSIPAFNMLQQAGQNGKIKIIESSSGNTAASLGVLAQYFGYNDVHAYVSHEVSPGKLNMLRLFGVTPLVNVEPICPSENDDSSGINKARKKGEEAEWFNPDQYSSAANINAHYKVTGPEIWAQSEGKLNYFCAGLGTTGTLIGTMQYLREQNPAVQSVGIVRSPNNPVPGPRTKNLLQDIQFDWNAQCDHITEVGTVKAYDHSLQLIRSGVLAGPSSGMNMAGTYQFIEYNIQQGLFKKGQDRVDFVFVCCDTPFPYMNDYFSILPEESFPSIHNKHLLQFQDTSRHLSRQDVPQVTPEELLERQTLDPDNTKIIDIRPTHSYQHYHIPSAISIPLDGFVSDIETLSDIYRRNKLYFVCDFGGTSSYITRHALRHGLDAYSVKGGMTEWSDLDLPRVKHEQCILKYNLK